MSFEDFSILQNHYGQTVSAGEAPAADGVTAALPCGSLGVLLLAMFGMGVYSAKCN